MRSLDVLVVGGGAAALTTAALLGKRGYRGLVVDNGELDDTQHYPRDNWSWDDAHAPALARVHELLGLQAAFRRSAQAIRPGLRLITQDKRVELEPEDSPADVLARLLQLDRITIIKQLRTIEKSSKKVAQFLESVSVFPASGFFERRKATNAINDCDELSWIGTDYIHPELCSHLEALLPFLTHFGSSAPAPARMGRLARPARLLLQGPRLPSGRSLRLVLAERAARGGFEIHRGQLSVLQPDGRRLKVEATQRRAPALVNAVVDASSHLSAVRMLSAHNRYKKLAPILDEAAPRDLMALFEWELDASVLPEPLGQTALLLSSSELPSAWISIRPTNHSHRVRVVVELPGLDPQYSPDDLGNYLEIARNYIRSIAPFFEHGRAEAQTPRFRPLFDPQLDPHAGLGGLPVRTPVRNVILAGPVVLPGCVDMEGAYLSALQATEAVAELLGSRTLT